MPSTYIDRIDGVTTSAAVKTPVKIAVNTPITLSGVQTIQGVTLTAYSGPGLPADRVLVNGQADQTTNGIYLVQTGAWTREPDFDGARDAVTGTLVSVLAGTYVGGFFELTTTDNPIIIGTSNITWAQSPIGVFSATSVTSNAIGTGSKTFTTQAGLPFTAGQFILVVDSANSANYMHGQITSYSGTSLVVNVLDVGGSGTKTSWNIFFSGPAGPLPSISTTSTTSQTPGTGAFTFTVAAGLAFAPGQFVSAISSGAPTAFIVGNVTSYSGTSLVINSTQSGGSGAHTDWNISLAAAPGSALLNASQTFSGAQRVTVTALTSSSASIASDFSVNNDFSHTFTENTTLANPSNLVAGQSGCIFLTQHASSPKTLAYGSSWKFAGGTVPTVSAVNSAQDTLYYNVRDSTHIEANLVKGNA